MAFPSPFPLAASLTPQRTLGGVWAHLHLSQLGHYWHRVGGSQGCFSTPLSA